MEPKRWDRLVSMFHELHQKTGPERVALRVCDSGSAVPPEIESRLMRAPVSSRGGLGIGLYQAARQAEAAGYQLALEANRDGEVCFALTGPAA